MCLLVLKLTVRTRNPRVWSLHLRILKTSAPIWRYCLSSYCRFCPLQPPAQRLR